MSIVTLYFKLLHTFLTITYRDTCYWNWAQFPTKINIRNSLIYLIFLKFVTPDGDQK
jgi:hypothetical protein